MPAVTALYIEHTNTLPEYPNTHPEGYAYIINTQGMTAEEIQFLNTDVSGISSVTGFKLI